MAFYHIAHRLILILYNWAHIYYSCPSGGKLVSMDFIDGKGCRCIVSDSSLFGGATVVEPTVPNWPNHMTFG